MCVCVCVCVRVLQEKHMHPVGVTSPYLLLLEGLLLILILGELKPCLGDGHELLAVVLLELLDGILIDGVAHVQNLVPLLRQPLAERRLGNNLLVLAGDEVDVLHSNARVVVMYGSDV